MIRKLKKLLTLLTGRVFITALLIIVQLYWFAVVFFELTQYSAIISMVFQVLSLLIALMLVSSEENPSYRIAWITAVVALPVLGGPLYLIMGNKRPSKRMRARIDEVHRRFAPLLTQDDATVAALRAKDRRAAGLSEYLLDTGGYPLYDANHVTYYPVGEAMFEAMIEVLESAEHFIFLEYFIIQGGEMWDRILDILKRKAARGVDVRLIYDDVGSLFLLPLSFVKDMEQVGVKCLRFNPFVPFLSLVMNNRDHRKILVVDGHTAFNGGINLADEYINAIVKHGHWKDTGVKITGDAVWSFTLMFLEMWHAFRDSDEDVLAFGPNAHHPDAFEGEGIVQPFGDSPLDDEPLSSTVYQDILNQAQRYVYIFTPYLVIDDAMRMALANAAKRGVDVRVATPGVPDKAVVYRLTRSNYAPLLRAGVKVYEYTPGFLHAKSFVADDRFAVVGTINLDFRSLFLHFECGTYMYETSAVKALKEDCLRTFDQSREVSLSDTMQGFWGRLLDAVLRAFAPLC